MRGCFLKYNLCMKKFLIFVSVLLISLSAIAAENYSERFISSFSACEPYTERSTIKSGNEQVALTKLVQGVMDHKCIYKQVIMRPSVKDVTTCAFTKPMLEEIADAMKNETGEKFNVDFDTGKEVVKLYGLTKSQPIWSEYLNAEQVCKREIIPR